MSVMSLTAAGRQLIRRPLLMLAAAFAVVLAIQAVTKSASEWQDVYVQAARTLLQGGDIYAAGSSYLYPPFAAFAALPFAPLPRLPLRLAWFLINAFCAIGLIRLSWRLSGGERLDQLAFSDRGEWAILMLGLLFGGTFLLNALAHQQTDVVIAFLVMAGCLGLMRGRELSGGVLIGLAAAFKGPPLLFAAYCLFRRRWIAAAAIVITAAGANLLPDLVSTSPAGGTWVKAWLFNFVIPTQVHAELGTWGSGPLYNQSLGGTMQRLFNFIPHWTANGLAIAPSPSAVDPKTLKAIGYVLMLSMLAVSMAASVKGRASTQDKPRAPSQTVFEFAAVMALMVLLSPMSGVAHFGPLMLAAFCVARMGIAQGRRLSLALVLLATLLALTANKDLVGATMYTAALWAGTVAASALVLWAGCVIEIWRAGRPLPHFERTILSSPR